MDEIAAVDEYLGTVLRDYAPLRALILPAGATRPNLFSRTAPENQAVPYVVFNNNSDVPLTAIGGGLRRVKAELDYAIINVTEGNSLILASNIHQKVEAAITATPNKQITVDGDSFYVSIMFQVNAINYNEFDEGKRINYYGGLYRFFVNKTN